MPAPTKPDAVPRSFGAKRSATTVVSAACIELSAIVAPTQNRVIVHRLVICGTANRHNPPTTDPVTNHGVRRPPRVRVRSEKAPAIGVRSEERRGGKACVERVDLGGRRTIKKKKKKN